MGTPPTDPYNSRRPPGDDPRAPARSPWPVAGAAAAALVVGIVGGVLIAGDGGDTKTVTRARTVTAAGGGSTSKAQVTVVTPTTPAQTQTVVETATATVTVTVTTPTVPAP